MTHKNSSRTPSHELKLLITTVALAATLVGWGVLADREQTAVVDAAMSNTLYLTMPDLPVVATIVPAGLKVQGNTASRAADGTSAPTLRRVNAPPAPITITRSSR